MPWCQERLDAKRIDAKRIAAQREKWMLAFENRCPERIDAQRIAQRE